MKCEWKEIPFGELLEIPLRNGVSKPKSVRGNGYKMVNMGELFSNSRIYDIEMDRAPLTEKEKETSLVEVGDLLFARQSLVFSGAGKCSIIKEVCEPTTYESHLIRARINRDLASPDYMYYYFSSPQGRGRIQSIVEQVSAAGIRGSDLSKLDVSVPSLQIQEKIADILCCFDDKIELNNKINENLQQQAFCIFEKLLTEVSGESILVSDIADLNPKRALTKNQIAKCIDMAQLSTSGAFPDGWVDKPFKGGMRFANGDTLLARITPCLENGKTAFIDFLNEGEVAFGSTEYIVLSPKEGIPPEFLYCLARYPAFVDYAVKNMNGSSGRQRVSAETIGQYSLPRLSDEQYQTFGELASPMFRKMKNNWMENMRLAEVRDALLPKLMSGELNLSDI